MSFKNLGAKCFVLEHGSSLDPDRGLRKRRNLTQHHERGANKCFWTASKLLKNWFASGH